MTAATLQGRSVPLRLLLTPVTLGVLLLERAATRTACPRTPKPVQQRTRASNKIGCVRYCQQRLQISLELTSYQNLAPIVS